MWKRLIDRRVRSARLRDALRMQALEAELAACREQTGNLERELEVTKDRLIRALAETENLRRRFQRAKQTVVRLYHPDNTKGLNKRVCREIFAEYSQVLEDIERGKA